MKSEIAWLMEAFLEEDPKKIRVMIKDRMAEVTESLAPHRVIMSSHASRSVDGAESGFVPQAPSMQRIMQQNPDLIPKVEPPVTQAAAQALAARQALIMNAGNERPEPGRKGPRKI